MQCEVASMQEQLAVLNGAITNANGNQKMWQSDSKHVGDTMNNNGQVESSMESLVSSAIAGAGSAATISSRSIRNSL